MWWTLMGFPNNNVGILESSSIVNFSYEKPKKLSSKLGQHNGLCQHQNNLCQSSNVKNHMKPSSSTQFQPSQSNLDANCSWSCTSFHQTPINDHKSKLDTTHGTGISNFSFPQQISLKSGTNLSHSENKAPNLSQHKTWKTWNFWRRKSHNGLVQTTLLLAASSLP